ncbi:BATH-38 protein, partial [Aphelenchoides avenae]
MAKAGQRIQSPRQQVAGLGWQLWARPKVVGKVTYLECYLAGVNSFKWSASVDATFRIAKKNAAGFGKILGFRKQLMGTKPLNDDYGYEMFVTSEALLNAVNGFAVKDSVEIRVDFIVNDVRGASFQVFETVGGLAADVKLKVGDSGFFANKGYLSVISSVFRDMFALTEAAECETEMEEIELKGLDAGEFREFLAVIYPTRYPINDVNVISVFRIADRYDVQHVVTDCETYLAGVNSVPWFDKLKLTVDLRRDDLQKQLIEMMTCDDIKTVKQAENKDQLGDC